MNRFNIYLAGGMGSLSWEEQTSWREYIAEEIGKFAEGCFPSTELVFCSPPYYYNFEEPFHKTDKEVMRFDLYKIRNSDVVIVNFNDPKSIGTAMELAIAYEHNIPIIGINESENELHPWLAEVCTRICDDSSELILYVLEFYLT